MSAGKAAAQAVHAAMMMEEKYRESFTKNTRRSVIVLEAKGREQLDGIVDYLSDAKLEFQYYIDEGINEVAPFSFTALVVEPISEEDVKSREIFAGLPLYGFQEKDTYEGNYTESPIDSLYRDVNNLRNVIGQQSREIIQIKTILERPKWYQKLFKRNGFVS